MKQLVTFAACLVLLLSLNSFVTGQGWKFIGDKWAAFGADRDVLRVGGNDAYRQIKVKVTSGPLHIVDMDVFFENGEHMNVPLKNNFKAGQESRVIDFPGGVRRIDHITFLYSTVGRAKGRARIAVWGKG